MRKCCNKSQDQLLLDALNSTSSVTGREGAKGVVTEVVLVAVAMTKAVLEIKVESFCSADVFPKRQILCSMGRPAVQC